MSSWAPAKTLKLSCWPSSIRPSKLLLIQKAFDIREMIQVATEGIKSVVSAMLIPVSGPTASTPSPQTLECLNYVISVTGELDDPVTLLALAFAVCAFMSLFHRHHWGVYAIMDPHRDASGLQYDRRWQAAIWCTPPSLLSWRRRLCFGDPFSPHPTHHHFCLSGCRLRPRGSVRLSCPTL